MHFSSLCLVSSFVMTFTFAANEEVAAAAIKEFEEWLKTESTGLKLKKVSQYETSIQISNNKEGTQVALVDLQLNHASTSPDYVYVTMRKVANTWQLSGVGEIADQKPKTDEIESTFSTHEWGWTYVWNLKNSTCTSNFIRERVVDSGDGKNTIRVYKKAGHLSFEACRAATGKKERLKFTSPSFASSNKLNERIRQYYLEEHTAFRLEPWADVSEEMKPHVTRLSSLLPKTELNETPTFRKIRQFGDTPDKFFLLYKLKGENNKSVLSLVLAVRFRKYFQTNLRICHNRIVAKSEEAIHNQILEYLKTEQPFLAERMNPTEVLEVEKFLPWVKYNLRDFNPSLGMLKLVSIQNLNINRRIGVYAQIDQKTQEAAENGYVWVSAVKLTNDKLQFETIRQQELESELKIAKEIENFEGSSLPIIITEWLTTKSKPTKLWTRFDKKKTKDLIAKNSKQTLPKLLNLVHLGLTETGTTVAMYNCENKRRICTVWKSKYDIEALFEVDQNSEFETDVFHYFQNIKTYGLIVSGKEVEHFAKYQETTEMVKQLIHWRSVVGEVERLVVQQCVLDGDFEFLVHTFGPATTEQVTSKRNATVIFAVINRHIKTTTSSPVLYVSPPLDEITANQRMKSFVKNPRCMLEDWTKLESLPDTVQNQLKKLTEPRVLIKILSNRNDWKGMDGLDKLQCFEVKSKDANGVTKMMHFGYVHEGHSVDGQLEFDYNKGNLSIVGISPPKMTTNK